MSNVKKEYRILTSDNTIDIERQINEYASQGCVLHSYHSTPPLYAGGYWYLSAIIELKFADDSFNNA